MKNNFRKIKNILILFCIVLSLVFGGCVNNAADNPEANTKYQYAKELLERDKYELAIEQLIDIVDYKDAEKILFDSSITISNLLLGIENYQQVIDLLEPVILKFEQNHTSKRHIALLKVAAGKAYYEIGEFDHAEQYFQIGKIYTHEATDYLNRIRILRPFQGDWQNSEYSISFSYRISGETIHHLTGGDSAFHRRLIIKSENHLEDEKSEYSFSLLDEELYLNALGGATFREGQYYKLSFN